MKRKQKQGVTVSGDYEHNYDAPLELRRGKKEKIYNNLQNDTDDSDDGSLLNKKLCKCEDNRSWYNEYITLPVGEEDD